MAIAGGSPCHAPSAIIALAVQTRTSNQAPRMPLPPLASPSTVDLSDRVILITGATGGLGRGLALACARSGATVVLHGRTVRKLEMLYDEIVAGGHPQPTML